MKLLLIASWISALQAYPQSLSECHKTEANGGSCGSGGVQFAGYPPRREMPQNQDMSPECNNDESSCSGLTGAHFSGYPPQREMDKIQTSSNGFKPASQPTNTQKEGNDIAYDESPKSTNEEEREPQIQKHIYFHAAPPENEIPPQQRTHTPPTRQKHYTIIFIDTSKLVGPTRQSQQMAANQNEEKTIVYVLVKKPEEQADSVAPQVPITAPNKPEVYFIKYEEQRESKPTMELQKPKSDAPYPPKMETGLKHRRNLFFK